MKPATLFDSEYDQAVRDMIAAYQELLKTATTALERKELRMAIKSWEAALEPPMKSPPYGNAPSSAIAPRHAQL